MGAGERGSHGPKWALVLDEPIQKNRSEVADRLVMTIAEKCGDLGAPVPVALGPKARWGKSHLLTNLQLDFAFFADNISDICNSNNSSNSRRVSPVWRRPLRPWPK